MCHQHGVHLAFDAVAGEMTGQLLRALPEHNRVTLFSALSHEAARVSPNQIVFEDKAVDGFWLGRYIAKNSLLQIPRMWRRAQKLMLN